MNCTEAEVLLAAHRELNNDDAFTTELDAHLEQCASCRQVLARYSLIGEKIRSLPAVDPPPDMYSKLMQALAVEHSQFIQRSASVQLPPPEFLKPYLREHAYSSSKTDPLAAFSSADTGPLPVIKAVHKKRRHSSLGQFATIGLAAVFFMALMMGGITSLLLAAHDHVVTPDQQVAIIRPTNVAEASYTTSTLYNNVVSAVANRTSIYYTAYGNGSNTGWMLEQLDRATKISRPLLAQASTSPLIVLGSANGWLLWLQFDEPRISKSGVIPNPTSHSLTRTWSLRYLSLVPEQVKDNSVPNQPVTLLSGTFDQNATARWISTPIQGIWFIQNTLLVAMVDENGVSHLVRYPLGTNNAFKATEIAKTSSEHIITSPTANSDGTQIYWAEEWRTDDANLHSNIWTQQVLDAPLPLHGQVARHKMTVKQLFLKDGTSFRPMVVNEDLFLLSTANSADVPQATPSATAGATSTTTPVSATPNTSTPPMATWANSDFYSAALDVGVRGTLVMYPLSDALDVLPTPVSATGSASSLQAGNDFVLWQNGDGSYGMYDTVTKSNPVVGGVLNDAQFLAVNGDTAVWTNSNAVNTTSNDTAPAATLETFSWPMK